MLMLFAGRDFVRLWATGAMTSTVRWLDLLVVGVFTFQTTQSALSTSLVLFLRLLPLFLLGAFVGVLAERINRRFLLMGATAVLVATYGVLGTLAYSGRLAVSHVALGALISGVVWAIETPVRRTMVMEAVGIPRIGAAMGVETATQNLSRMLGPLMGGLLLEGIGMQGTYWLGGLCCLVSLGLLSGVGVGGAPLAATRPNFFTDLKAGLQYVATDRAIQAVLFCTISVNLFGFSYAALVPVIGESELNLSAVQIGFAVGRRRRCVAECAPDRVPRCAEVLQPALSRGRDPLRCGRVLLLSCRQLCGRPWCLVRRRPGHRRIRQHAEHADPLASSSALSQPHDGSADSLHWL
jgi:hypothetical protein